jgi:hypothetical protein
VSDRSLHQQLLKEYWRNETATKENLINGYYKVRKEFVVIRTSIVHSIVLRPATSDTLTKTDTCTSRTDRRT